MIISNARNLQLHVSYNGMVNSECEVEIEKVFNSTVHLSFQVMEWRKFDIVIRSIIAEPQKYSCESEDERGHNLQSSRQSEHSSEKSDGGTYAVVVWYCVGVVVWCVGVVS